MFSNLRKLNADKRTRHLRWKYVRRCLLNYGVMTVALIPLSPVMAVGFVSQAILAIGKLLQMIGDLIESFSIWTGERVMKYTGFRWLIDKTYERADAVMIESVRIKTWEQ